MRGSGGGGTSISWTIWVCLGGGLMAGFGGRAGFGAFSGAVSGVPAGVLLDCGGDKTKDCGD